MKVGTKIWAIAFLVLVTAAGAWLRLEPISSAPLWLDELLNVQIIRDLDLPPHAWLIGFERENGPLYFALHSLSLAAFDSLELGMRLPEAIAGIASIVLIFFVAVRITADHTIALTAALLLAVSPFHLRYSVEGRPYALLVLFSLLLTDLLADRSPPKISRLSLTLIAAAATAATSVPLLGAALLIALASSWDRDGKAPRRGWITSASLVLVSIALAAFFYARFPQSTAVAGFNRDVQTIGALILNGLMMTGEHIEELQVLALAGAVLAIIGFVSLENRRTALVLVSMVVFPIAISLGALFVRDHWFSLRYIIHGLAPFLILVAAGIVHTSRSTAALLRMRGRPLLVGLFVVLLLIPIVVTGISTNRDEIMKRPDWRRIASVVANHASDDDLVIASSAWSRVSIDFYLCELGRELDVREIHDTVETAQVLLGERQRAWIVVGGFETSSRIRRWACQYFLAGRDEEEDIRLYYAPGLFDFLEHRATQEESERFDASVNRRIEMEPWDDELLIEGWYGPERAGDETFRWARRRAAVILPLAGGDTTLSFRANPIGPNQHVSVVIGGTTALESDMPEQPTDYRVPIAGTTAGLVRIDFLFAREEAPSETGSSTDSRPLSAAFDWIRIGDAAADDPGAPLLLHPAGYTDARQGRTGCVAADEIRGAGRRRLMTHLGYAADFDGTLPAAIVDSLPAPECLSDAELVDRLFMILFGRRADHVGAVHYRSSLAAGESPEEVVCRMITSEEFQQQFGNDAPASTPASD